MLKPRTRASRAPLRLEFRQLEAFLAIVDHGSLRKAAQALGMSQPPLSRQISLLEAELKVQLFERSSAGMVLSGSGQELVYHARAILDRTMQAARDMQSALDDPMNRLSIGYIDDFQHGFLPRLLHDFARQRPGLKLRSSLTLTANLFESLRRGQIDAGFVTLPLPMSARTLNLIRFPPVPLVAVLPEAHPLAREERLNLRQLSGERFIYPAIAPESGFSVQMTSMFQRAGFKLEVALEAWPTVHIIQFVQRGYGVTLTMADSFMPVANPTVVQVPLDDPDATIVPALVWREAGATRTLRSFLDMCRLFVESGRSTQERHDGRGSLT